MLLTFFLTPYMRSPCFPTHSFWPFYARCSFLVLKLARPFAMLSALSTASRRLSASKRVLSPLQQSFFSTSEEEYVSVVDFEPFLKGDEADQVEVARKIGNACRHNGFLILTGHQVSKPTIDAAWQSARNYFDLPEEVKVQGLMTDDNPYGFSFSLLSFNRQSLQATLRLEERF